MIKQKTQQTNWHKCSVVKVISKKNEVLLDILNGKKYKLENGWVVIKDCCNQTHIFPSDLVRKVIVK